jgi:hypothetical protein
MLKKPASRNYIREDSEMVSRPYSASVQAVRIFSDVLNSVARRGWFSGSPSADGKSLLYASFHIHPDDVDYLCALLQKAIKYYGGETEWSLIRMQPNRFIICPRQVSEIAEKLGSVSDAAEEVRKLEPTLGWNAANDLILLSDYLYSSQVKNRAADSD